MDLVCDYRFFNLNTYLTIISISLNCKNLNLRAPLSSFINLYITLYITVFVARAAVPKFQ